MSVRLSDPILGELTYQHGWVRDFSVNFLCEQHILRLIVPCDEGAVIETAQRDAFQHFEERRESLLQQAENTLLAHYMTIRDEKSKQFGLTHSDLWAPRITCLDQLSELVTPTEVVIQQTFGASDRMVGLLLECLWEQSQGVAIKFINEEVVEVGPQDIVL